MRPERCRWGGGGVGTRPRYLIVCLLAAPIGLSPLLILTLCGRERVLAVSTEPLDDLSCLNTPGVGCPGRRRAVARAVDRCIQMHTPSPCRVCRLHGRGGGGGGRVRNIPAPPYFGALCTVAGPTALGIHSGCTNNIVWDTHWVHKLMLRDTQGPIFSGGLVGPGGVGWVVWDPPSPPPPSGPKLLKGALLGPPGGSHCLGVPVRGA